MKSQSPPVGGKTGFVPPKKQRQNQNQAVTQFHEISGLVGRALELTGGRGADLVFDPIGGPLLAQLAQAAGERATIIEYGALSPSETPFPLFLALAKALTFRGYTLFEVTRDAERLNRAKEFVYEGLQAGRLKPIIDKTFPLTKIKDAHKYMESNQQCGKVVVTV